MVVMDSGAAVCATSAAAANVAEASQRSSLWYDQQQHQQHQQQQALEQPDLADAYFKGQQNYFSQMQQVGAAYQGMPHGKGVKEIHRSI